MNYMRSISLPETRRKRTHTFANFPQQFAKHLQTIHFVFAYNGSIACAKQKQSSHHNHLLRCGGWGVGLFLGNRPLLVKTQITLEITKRFLRFHLSNSQFLQLF